MTPFATDHHLDDFVVGLRAREIARDIGAVAKDGAVVGKLGDLVHAVRDIDERETLVAQSLQDHEDPGHVRRGQRRRRLVQNEDTRVARQRLGDLDHLSARQRQIPDERHRVDVRRAGALQRFLGDAPLRPPVDQSEPAGRVADGNIVGDREVGNERKLLEDADDAGAIGGGRQVEGNLVAIKHNASRVRLHDARKNLDQRRLAGAVFAENGVNPSRVDREIGLLERAHAAIALGHALHAQDRGARLHPRQLPRFWRKGSCGAAQESERRRAAATCSPSSGP